MRAIAIYFDGYDPERSTIPLAAACGVGQHHGLTVLGDRFTALHRFADKTFTVVSGHKDADLIVYPHVSIFSPTAQRVSEAAAASEKPCLFFYHSDDATPSSLPYGVIYRTSIERSMQTGRERAMPAAVEDLSHLVANVRSRDRATVSFCGFVGSRVRSAAYRLAGKFGNVDPFRLRQNALDLLAGDGRLKVEFIRRSRFLAGTTSRLSFFVPTIQQARAEYLHNMAAGHYALAIRGIGNYSFRFYEALSAGRVPIFVDTDCLLPFEDQLDYAAHCIVLDFRHLSAIGDSVHQFHEANHGHLSEAMAANVELWQEYLSPPSFYRRAIERTLAGDGTTRC